MLAAVCRLQPVLLILMTSVRTLPPAGISQHSVLNVFDKLVFTFFWIISCSLPITRLGWKMKPISCSLNYQFINLSPYMLTHASTDTRTFKKKRCVTHALLSFPLNLVSFLTSTLEVIDIHRAAFTEYHFCFWQHQKEVIKILCSFLLILSDASLFASLIVKEKLHHEKKRNVWAHLLRRSATGSWISRL